MIMNSLFAVLGFFSHLSAIIPSTPESMIKTFVNITRGLSIFVIIVGSIVFVWNRKKYWDAYRVASACSMSLSALLLTSAAAESKNKIWFNLLAVGIIGATAGIGYIGFKKMKEEPAADEGTAKDPNNF